MNRSERDALIRRRCKVELHLHLEGTLRPATVGELARRHDPTSPFGRPGWETAYWSFADLAGFVTQFGAMLRACIRSAADYHRIAVECFEDLAAQQVVYAEISVSPRPPGRPHYVPLDETLAAVDQARREVEASTPLRVGVLVGIGRHHAAAHPGGAGSLAQAVVAGALGARERGAAIAGIDLQGDEAAAPDAAPFAAAYRLAAEAGLGRRAHAGESTGPRTVWGVVDQLGVTRIAHGVRAASDPALLRHLAAKQVALDVCPTSNVRTGAVGSLAQHPIRRLHEAGVPVTVSSDDPLVFGQTVSDELALVHRQFGFSLDDLGQLNIQAARHSFLPPDRRLVLAETIRRSWKL